MPKEIKNQSREIDIMKVSKWNLYNHVKWMRLSSEKRKQVRRILDEQINKLEVYA